MNILIFYKNFTIRKLIKKKERRRRIFEVIPKDESDDDDRSRKAFYGNTTCSYAQ